MSLQRYHAFFWLWVSCFAWNVFPGELLQIFHKSSQMPFPQWILSECPQAELDYLTWSSHGAYKVNIFTIVLIAGRLSSYTRVCPHGWQMQSLIILIIHMCHLCIWNRWMSLILDEEKPRIPVGFTGKVLVMRDSLPGLLSCIWDPVSEYDKYRLHRFQEKRLLSFSSSSFSLLFLFHHFLRLFLLLLYSSSFLQVQGVYLKLLFIFAHSFRDWLNRSIDFHYIREVFYHIFMKF